MQQTFSSKLTQIAVATACAAMLAACGGGGDGDSNNNSSGNTEQPGGGTNTGGGNNNSGGGSNSDGALHPAGDFTATTVKFADRVATIGKNRPLPLPYSEPLGFHYFKTNRATEFVEGWVYHQGTNQNFAYDVGQYVYFSDTKKFEEPSTGKKLDAYSFLGNQVIMGCEAADWKSTFVVNLNGKEITHLPELDGKSYKQYSCDPGEVNGYDPVTITNGMLKDIPVAQLFSSSGYKNSNGTYYYKAYSIYNKIFAVGHDSTGAGVSLIIQD